MAYCPAVEPAPYIRIGVDARGGGVVAGKESGIGKESWLNRV